MRREIFTEKSHNNGNRYIYIKSLLWRVPFTVILFQRNILKSVLVKLTPVGQNKDTNEEISISVVSTFMATYSTSQYKVIPY